jgi:hypothetical protein
MLVNVGKKFDRRRLLMQSYKVEKPFCIKANKSFGENVFCSED